MVCVLFQGAFKSQYVTQNLTRFENKNFKSHSTTRNQSGKKTMGFKTLALKTLQSKCLRVIGNFPRRTPVSLLHASLNIPPIREFVYQLTVKFFSRCPNNPNTLINTIGNYSLTDQQSQYQKYIHKRPKHILL